MHIQWSSDWPHQRTADSANYLTGGRSWVECIHGNKPHPQVQEKLESLRKEVESLEAKVGVAKDQYQKTVAAAQVLDLSQYTWCLCYCGYMAEWLRCSVCIACIPSE